MAGQWGGQEQQAGFFGSPHTVFPHFTLVSPRQPHNTLVVASCSWLVKCPVAMMWPNPGPNEEPPMLGWTGGLGPAGSGWFPHSAPQGLEGASVPTQNVAGSNAGCSQSCRMWVMAEQHFGCSKILPACNQSWATGKQAARMLWLSEAGKHLALLSINICGCN